MSVGTKLVELCKQGKNRQAVEELYDDNIVSIEAMGDEKMPARQEGKEAALKKHDWWEATFDVANATTDGPFYNDTKDEFTVYFTLETTHKETGKHEKHQEVGRYKEKDGKIIEEQFYYGDGN